MAKIRYVKGIPIKEYRRKYNIEYYKKNKKKIYLKKQEYRHNHKDKVSMWNRKYYLKIKNLWDLLTQEEQFNLRWGVAKRLLKEED